MDGAEIQVLGPLALACAQQLALTVPPKPRKVLALLAMNVGRVVPTTSLLRELWDDSQPRTSMTTLQTYVGQIRRTLATALHIGLPAVTDEVLRTEDGGYCLTSAVAVDYQRYTRLDQQGKAAVRAGDDRRGMELLRQALAVWRGPALVNVAAGPLLRAQVVLLEERWLCTVEHRIVAELRLGEHYSLVSELKELTSQHPLHEGLHGHLMLALHRCERRSEALAVFRTLRSRLVAELGLEPGPELAKLERAILNGDPALDLVDGRKSLSRLRAS